MSVVDELAGLVPVTASVEDGSVPGTVPDATNAAATAAEAQPSAQPRRRRRRRSEQLERGQSRTKVALGALLAEAAAEEPRSCCRCGCCQELLKRELCGFPLPKLGMLLASVSMPILDASSDWAVTYSFYANGDMGWFQIGLTIQLVGGFVAGMAFLTVLLAELQGDDDCDEMWPEGSTAWLGCCCMCLGGLAVGVAGLAPVAVAAWTLKHGYDGEEDDAKEMLKALKYFKVMELICEALPQSLLQSYVGVSYGKFNPSAEEYFKPTDDGLREPFGNACSNASKAFDCGADEVCLEGDCGTMERSFDPLLSASVCLSLFSAGSTLFGIEMMTRNGDESALITMSSRYGVATLLLRAAQFGSTIFGIALLGCAIKGSAVVFAVLAVFLFIWLTMEAVNRDEDQSDGFGDNGGQSKACCIFECLVVTLCCGPQRLCTQGSVASIVGSVILDVYHLLFLGVVAFVFNVVEHVPNNFAAYPDMDAPAGFPGADTSNVTEGSLEFYEDNYFDCHERTSGIYPALFGACCSVLLMILSNSSDPKFGHRRCMGEEYEEGRTRRFIEAIDPLAVELGGTARRWRRAQDTDVLQNKARALGATDKQLAEAESWHQKTGIVDHWCHVGRYDTTKPNSPLVELIRELRTSQGADLVPLTPQQITVAQLIEIWKDADINGDGALNRQDGTRWLKRTGKTHLFHDHEDASGYKKLCEVMGTSGVVQSALGGGSKFERGPSRTQFMLWYSGIDKGADDAEYDHSENAQGAPWKKGQIAKVEYRASELKEMRARKSISDTHSTDTWHVLHQTTLTGPLTGLKVSARWRDQGWGNQKGQVRAALQRDSSEVQTVAAFPGTAPHDDTAVQALLPPDFVAAAQLGDVVRFEYCVGGGGGHELYIEDFRADFAFEAEAKVSEAEEAVRVYFGQLQTAPDVNSGRTTLLWVSDDAPPETTVDEAKLGRVTEEEWEKAMQDLLQGQLGSDMGSECRETIDADFKTLGLSLPRKGGDQNFCLVLLGCS